MILRFEQETPERVEMAELPHNRPWDALARLSFTMILASLPAALALLSGVSSRWGAAIFGFCNLFGLLIMFLSKRGRIIVADGTIRFIGTSDLLPTWKQTFSCPLQAAEVKAHYMREVEANLVIRFPGQHEVVISVPGVRTSYDIEDLKTRLGLGSGYRRPATKIDPPAWPGRLPMPGKLVRRDDQILEFKASQSLLSSLLFPALSVVLGFGAAWLIRRGGTMPIIAGAELAVAAAVWSVVTGAAFGSLPFRIDSGRRSVADLKSGSSQLIPFEAVKAVVLRQISPAAWVLYLEHSHSTALMGPLRGEDHRVPLLAFGGEIARRIGVPLLEYPTDSAVDLDPLVALGRSGTPERFANAFLERDLIFLSIPTGNSLDANGLREKELLGHIEEAAKAMSASDSVRPFVVENPDGTSFCPVFADQKAAERFVGEYVKKLGRIVVFAMNTTRGLTLADLRNLELNPGGDAGYRLGPQDAEALLAAASLRAAPRSDPPTPP